MLFNRWKETVKGYPKFEEVAKTVDSWYTEIFNYFDKPYTNAITESLNKVINDLNNAGKGYSFDVLRLKAIHKSKAKEKAKFKFVKKSVKAPVSNGFDAGNIGYMTMKSFIKPLSVSYKIKTVEERIIIHGDGVNIKKLQNLLDDKEWQ